MIEVTIPASSTDQCVMPLPAIEEIFACSSRQHIIAEITNELVFSAEGVYLISRKE